MKLTVQTNCKNFIEIQGYADSIKFYKEEKDGFGERDVLSFTLHHINNYSTDATTNKKKVFFTPFKVIAYKNRAVEVHKWLKYFQLVTVQGKGRLTKHGFTIIAAFIEPSQPQLSEIDIEPEKEGTE